MDHWAMDSSWWNKIQQLFMGLHGPNDYAKCFGEEARAEKRSGEGVMTGDN